MFETKKVTYINNRSLYLHDNSITIERFFIEDEKIGLFVLYKG